MDSRLATLEHIETVRQYMNFLCHELKDRAEVHDASKLESPEKEYFDQLTEDLKRLTYGSKEYQESLEKLRPALDHHYAKNSHHPQHYPECDTSDVDNLLEDINNGGLEANKEAILEVLNQYKNIVQSSLNHMDLLDVLEMLCDWKAATERHNDGNIHKSLSINRERFKMSIQLYNILENTINRYLL